ncbi:MAG: hypothetical protein D6815_04120 [Candidatus Dadabacteria bacterium]|nr:MAG: hypothetical protein D6815_04120 [Candidatus Dadabacteria bacterium]
MTPFKDKLKWAWRGAADASGVTTSVGLGDLGDPLLGTDYALCIYDSVAGTPQFVASFEVPGGTAAWKPKNLIGFSFKDKVGDMSDGIRRVLLRAGLGKKSRAKVIGRGTFLALPPPFDASRFFAAENEVTVQLVNSSGTCWNALYTVGDFGRNNPRAVKAKE